MGIESAKGALIIIINFLKLTPLSDFAAQLEKDLEDDNITLHEGVDLAAVVTLKAEQYFPGQAPEIDLAHDVAVAVGEYLGKKEAAAPPAPPPA